MAKQEKSKPDLEKRVRFLELEDEQWNRYWQTVLNYLTIAAITLAAFVVLILMRSR